MEENFVTKYFSFILLGLMLCIGYVILRTRKKPPEGEWNGVENALQKAEREARGLGKGGELDELSPGPEREAVLRRAREAMQHSDAPAPDQSAPPQREDRPS